MEKGSQGEWGKQKQQQKQKKQETRIANELNKCATKFGQTRVFAGIKAVGLVFIRGIDWSQLFINKVEIVFNKISSWQVRVDVEVTGEKRGTCRDIGVA